MARKQAATPGLRLTELFQGQVRVLTVLGEDSSIDIQTRSTYFTMQSPREQAMFKMAYIVLYASENSVVIG